MLKFNHINLSTTAVPGLSDFFERCLDFKVTERRGSNKFAVLIGEGPFYLILCTTKTPRVPSILRCSTSVSSWKTKPLCERPISE
jgi:hypothetical protein